LDDAEPDGHFHKHGAHQWQQDEPDGHDTGDHRPWDAHISSQTWRNEYSVFQAKIRLINFHYYITVTATASV
jgi:hypothetical protein